MPKPTKTRLELAQESASAAVACFNYYSDKPLGDEKAEKLEQFLHDLFPGEITTEEWSEYAESYDKRVADEAAEEAEENEGCCESPAHLKKIVDKNMDESRERAKKQP